MAVDIYRNTGKKGVEQRSQKWLPSSEGDCKRWQHHEWDQERRHLSGGGRELGTMATAN